MSKQKAEGASDCARCGSYVCYSPNYMDGPASCPTKCHADAIEEARALYRGAETAEFARLSSVLEGRSYMRVPWAPAVPSPATTRLEEIVRFARMMGYGRLGLAFCIGVRNEARTLARILLNRGFEVVSVCCKTGGIPKEELGVKDEEKIIPGSYEAMCNPIGQAKVLNEEKCDLNILLGLYVGHDSLFIKHSEAPITVFAVKDRLLGHNPLAALYQSNQYYARLIAPEPESEAAGRPSGKKESEA